MLFASDSATIAGRKPHEKPTFSVDSGLVLLPVTVTDGRGATVTGLTKGQFQVFEDNVPRSIASFGEEDVPVSIGIVFDTSGSMQGVLKRSQEILRRFIDEANPQDEASLVTVSTRPGAEVPFTGDLGTIPQHLLSTEAFGGTALVDAIYSAVIGTRKAHNGRKALLVISDGMDNHSRYSKPELMSLALESDVQVYAISVFDPPLNRKPIELKEEREGLAFLEELARRTGGVALVARGERDAEEAAAKISRAMRDEYVIGLAPSTADSASSESGPGRWHPLRVGLDRSGVKTWSRSGYFAR